MQVAGTRCGKSRSLAWASSTRTLKEARENLKDALVEILVANHEISLRTKGKARREPVMVEVPA